MPLITATELARFAPHGMSTIADAVVAHADVALPKWGINTAPRLWMFMAMCKVESAGFSALFENMDYSAQRLVEVWPSRYPTLAAAQPYAHNPIALADKVYSGRLGNVEVNDGWLLRGQGLLQITGRANISRLAKAMGVTVDQCRAMLTADATMLECAAATFATWGCLPFADNGDVHGCTEAINGGLTGLPDRQAAYALAKVIWPTIRVPAPLVASQPIPDVHIDNLPVVIANAKPTGLAWLWAKIIGKAV